MQLLKAAKRPTDVVVRRSSLDPPRAEKRKQQTTGEPVVPKAKAAAEKKNTGSNQSATEPVVSNANAVAGEKSTRRQRSTAELVAMKKRKQTPGSEQSTPEPVVRNKTQRRASLGDPRRNLIAKNVNTDVVKGNQLQIKVGHTVYNATVTKVLSDDRVKVCTKDKDANIAKIKFKIVRLTEEQAKSGKPSGFTSKKVNVDFPVKGAHDD